MGTLVLLTLGLAVGTNLPLACVLLNRIIPFIYSIINIEITPIAERNVQNQDTSSELHRNAFCMIEFIPMGWLGCVTCDIAMTTEWDISIGYKLTF